jgi:hypothetical protein
MALQVMNRGTQAVTAPARAAEAHQRRDAHAVEPDPAFVERLHRQLHEAFSRTSQSTKPVQYVPPSHPRAEP